MKTHFFTQFENDIDRIDKVNQGFKRRVYASHFSDAFKELIRYGNFGLAIKLYCNYGAKGGMLFWKFCFNRIGSWIGRKFRHEP